MLRFIVRRLLLLVPILLGLSILIFFWIRALPGGPTEALLGERATPAAVAQIRHQLGLDKPIYEQYWAYVRTTAEGNLGISISSRRPVTTEIRERFPATVELTFAAMIFASEPRHPARVLRREATRERVRPRELSRLADRDLDPDLLPRAHPQVHLLGAARLAPEHRPPGRADQRAAPDRVLRARRDHHRELERGLGRDQAPDPAGDRARLDPARDHRADHARLRARRPERGLRAHGAREGDVAARSSTGAT